MARQSQPKRWGQATQPKRGSNFAVMLDWEVDPCSHQDEGQRVDPGSHQDEGQREAGASKKRPFNQGQMVRVELWACPTMTREF